MKTSWKWLADWVELDGLTPQDVADKLTLAGLENEAIEVLGEGMDEILVGEIASIEPHPKADRLVICQIDAGEGSLRQIVCGATNMKVGDRVPVALPGSQPPTFDFVIGERKMRGVLSQGMLCGGDEIGLDDGVDGLLILPATSPIGVPVFEALNLKDTVLHWGLTPNRPDCLSHRGVAREIAALYGRELKPMPGQESPAIWESGVAGEVSQKASLTIEDYEGCPRYGLTVIEGVKVGPSPQWLKARLQSIGLRSINNIVDITNFVNFDLGQPLHAFDLDRLEGSQIIVRRAHAGEKLVGINHKDYELDPQDLVIADAGKPVAIAGVMGGEGCEVTDQTTRVLLECAYFDPTTVRKSSKRHALHTDSSHRFERGIDAGATRLHLERATQLLVSVAGDDVMVAKGHGYAEHVLVQPGCVTFPVGEVSRVLGIELEPSQIKEVMASIELGVQSETEDAITFIIPTWRPDLERPIDLIEEIARLIGFDAIPGRLPVGVMGAPPEMRADRADHGATILSDTYRESLSLVREQLLAQGLYEVVNFSFMSEAELDALELPADDVLRDARKLLNPLNQDVSLMRTTLLTGLLRNLETNLAQRRFDVALFELGRRYLADGAEPLTLGCVLTGKCSSHWSGAQTWDFYDAKGLVEALASTRDLPEMIWQVPSPVTPAYHPGVQAVWANAETGEVLASIGRLHPVIEQKRGLPEVFCIEMDLASLLAMPARALNYEGVSKFPPVTRDFALVQSTGEQFARVEDVLRGLATQDELLSEIYQGYQVFDVYQGDRIEEGKRSVALQVTLRAEDRTLTDEEISRASQAIIDMLEQDAGVKLRA